MNDIMQELFEKLYEEKYGCHITDELAASLVEDMAVTDGTDRESGQKWTMAECKDYGVKLGVDFEKVSKAEWYLIMNMMYSDHYRTAKKHGLMDPVFFAELSFDWFYDVDAAEDKTFKYFMS